MMSLSMFFLTVYLHYPFHGNALFLYPLKTWENQRFSDVFKGCRNGTLAWKGVMKCWLLSVSRRLFSILLNIYNRGFCGNNPLSASPTKWSNTLKQFVGCCRRIACVCLTILWGWRLMGYWHLASIFAEKSHHSCSTWQEKCAPNFYWCFTICKFYPHFLKKLEYN